MGENNSSGSGPICPPQTYPGFPHTTKPDFTVGACLVECPNSPSGALTVYFDALDLRTGIRLHNLMAEIEEGGCTVSYGLDAQVQWTSCSPLESMKMPCAPYTVTPGCQREFEEALGEAVKKRIGHLLLVAEYESRFVPDFKDAVREKNWDDGRVPKL